MFGTILSYISLRLLGVSPEDPAGAKGLKFIRENGGGTMAPSWAKFWMAVLGVYEWEVRWWGWTGWRGRYGFAIFFSILLAFTPFVVAWLVRSHCLQ